MSSAQPSELISCYDDLGFEQHEWGKHGVCAGVKDAKDFFTQVCALATAPLKVMTATVSGGGDVTRAASDLKAAGYAIFDTDPKNAQVCLTLTLALPPPLALPLPLATMLRTQLDAVASGNLTLALTLTLTLTPTLTPTPTPTPNPNRDPYRDPNPNPNPNCNLDPNPDH